LKPALRLTRTGRLKHRFHLFTESVPTAEFEWTIKGGTATVNSKTYYCKRTGWLRPTFEMSDGTSVLFTARSAGLVSQIRLFDWKGDTYTLRPRSSFPLIRTMTVLFTNFVLLKGEEPFGTFKTDGTVELLCPTENEFTLFVILLILSFSG
jgi:hypothetical protein